MNKHKRTKHAESVKRYFCPLCSDRKSHYVQAHTLVEHFASVHKKVITTDYAKQFGKVVDSNPTIEPREPKIKLERLKCSHCDTFCTGSSNLKRHILRMHPTLSSPNNTIYKKKSSDEIQGGLVYEAKNDEMIQTSSCSKNANETISWEDVKVFNLNDQEYNEYEDYGTSDEFANNLQPESTEYESGIYYSIVNSQEESIQFDNPSCKTDVQYFSSQEQVKNEMIYNDLETRDDAFGFEMHGDRGEQHKGSVYFEAGEESSQECMVDENTGAEVRMVEPISNDEKQVSLYESAAIDKKRKRRAAPSLPKVLISNEEVGRIDDDVLELCPPIDESDEKRFFSFRWNQSNSKPQFTARDVNIGTKDIDNLKDKRELDINYTTHSKNNKIIAPIQSESAASVSRSKGLRSENIETETSIANTTTPKHNPRKSTVTTVDVQRMQQVREIESLIPDLTVPTLTEKDEAIE